MNFKLHKLEDRKLEAKVAIWENTDVENKNVMVDLHGAHSVEGELEIGDFSENMKDFIGNFDFDLKEILGQWNEYTKGKEVDDDEIEDDLEALEGYPLGYRFSSKFEDTTASLKRLATALGKQHPRFVICPSFGPTWLLAPEDADRGEDNEHATIANFRLLLSKAEGQVGVRPEKRWLIGHSMGGLNALILGMHAPELWSKLLLLDPMMMVSNYDTVNPLEMLIIGDSVLAAPRILVEDQIAERAWHNKINPVNGGADYLKNLPPTQLHSSLNSFWKFHSKHYELTKINEALNPTKDFKTVVNSGGHSFFLHQIAADFLLS